MEQMRKWIIAGVLLIGFLMAAKVSIPAEEEIHKFKDNNVLWFKNICNIDLRVFQAIWMEQMDRHSHTSVVAAPRVGKTYGVEMHGLKTCAINPFEDYRIFAPAEHQAKRALKYQIDAILGSPVLSAYVERRLGRTQLKETGYTFQNQSNTEYFGQNANIDSVNATILRGEEFDDIDMDIWKERILTRGMAENKNGLPTRIRITGVIQGKENLYSIELDKSFEKLQKIDVYLGLTLGILDKKIIASLREQYTDDQWLRIALVEYAESRNFFWSKHLRAIQKLGQKVGALPVVPSFGGRYESHGTVAFGLDMGAQGGSATSSKYSLHVMERIGGMKRWLYGEEFEPTIDPKQLRQRIVAIWDYFRPDGGLADAFDSNLVAQINDDLYSEGLISYNRQREHAENKVENWKHWTLQPFRFQGSVKHTMFKGLQNAIHQRMMIFPMVMKGGTEQWEADPKYAVLEKTLRQLENIRAVKGGASYLNYEMIKKSVGDDNVDTLALANAYLDEGHDNTIIVEGYGSGEKMIGHNAGAGDFLT